MDQIDPKASTSQIEDSSVIRPDTNKEFGSLLQGVQNRSVHFQQYAADRVFSSVLPQTRNPKP